MRFFICAVDEITLALPVDFAAEIIPIDRSGSGDAYLSLPLMFRKGGCQVHHGIVLKRCPGEPSARVILATPRIETDLDIPDGDIRSLPAFMGQPDMLPYLSGAVFTDTRMILTVNMDLLLKKISSMVQ